MKPFTLKKIVTNKLEINAKIKTKQNKTKQVGSLTGQTVGVLVNHMTTATINDRYISAPQNKNAVCVLQIH